MSTCLFLALVAAGGNCLGQAPAPPTTTDGPGRFPPAVKLFPPVEEAEAPPAAPRKPDMVLRWNEVLLYAIRTDKTAPPLAARNMAVVHAAIYDAVNAIYRTHQPYLVEVRPLPGSSPSAAAAVAAYRALVGIYPRQKKTFDDVLASCLAEVPDAESRDGGAALGEFVAEKVLEWRGQDGMCLVGKHPLRKVLGAWEPTPPAFSDALLPAWTNLKPFAIREGVLPRPAGPPPLHTAAYAAAFHEVKAIGGKDSRTRSPDQTEIARFWADGEGTSTPPGHWNRIARGVALEKGNGLMENARLFALLNISLADAGLACWIIKFHHDLWRPITAIRRAEDDGNPDTEPDPSWEPLLPTPPFPTYTSGHSTFSGAAAVVLAKCFGSDAIGFETRSEGLPGVRRSFPSFSAAALEAGKSRVYGGIHYEFDNADGLTNGRAVGEYICRHYLQPRPPHVVGRPAP